MAEFGPAPDTPYHIHVYGKYQDPAFQAFRVAAEFLARDRRSVQATVEGYFETQYEQQLRYIVTKYGGSFCQARPSQPVVFAETDDAVLYFANEKRFFDWAYKRFKYEDNTRTIFYKRIGNKTLQGIKLATGRTYAALGFAIGDDQPEAVMIELFDEECPQLARNFVNLIESGKWNDHKVHRVKPGCWVQAGDLVDGSGANSMAADGEYIKDESFQIPHDRAGLLGMSNHGKDTNGSQYYITLRELPFLDGKSVIFGRVISGMRAIWKISRLDIRNERPLQDVKVSLMPDSINMGEIQQQADHKEECAATKLQSMHRGKLARSEVEQKKASK